MSDKDCAQSLTLERIRYSYSFHFINWGSKTLTCLDYPIQSMSLAKYRQPSVIEQSMTRPTPVTFAIANADNVAVIPKEHDTKSARQLVGNQLTFDWLLLLIIGTMPEVLIQFKSCPGFSDIGPDWPYPETLNNIAFLFILNMNSGPKFNFSRTPGRKGSMMMSLLAISSSIVLFSFGTLGDRVIHILPRFIRFWLMRIEKGAGSFRPTRITCAP